MTPCLCRRGASFMARIQPSGDWAQDEQDAAAIEQLARAARLDESDGIALSTVSQLNDARAKAEDDRAKTTIKDSEVIEKTAMLDYRRRVGQARKELKTAPT